MFYNAILYWFNKQNIMVSDQNKYYHLNLTEAFSTSKTFSCLSASIMWTVTA